MDEGSLFQSVLDTVRPKRHTPADLEKQLDKGGDRGLAAGLELMQQATMDALTRNVSGWHFNSDDLKNAGLEEGEGWAICVRRQSPIDRTPEFGIEFTMRYQNRYQVDMVVLGEDRTGKVYFKEWDRQKDGGDTTVHKRTNVGNHEIKELQGEYNALKRVLAIPVKSSAR